MKLRLLAVYRALARYTDREPPGSGLREASITLDGRTFGAEFATYKTTRDVVDGWTLDWLANVLDHSAGAGIEAEELRQELAQVLEGNRDGRRIYVASSWRNDTYPEVVAWLREAGHQVYDFRNPPDGSSGFGWAATGREWSPTSPWSALEHRLALEHHVAEDGFLHDLAGMEWADTFLCVLPCGRSAHLEAGWATGRGIPTAFLMAPGQEPELMAKLATGGLLEDMDWLRDWLEALGPSSYGPPWSFVLRQLRNRRQAARVPR